MNEVLKSKIIERYGSQFEFARIIGANEADVSRVIRGRRILDQDTRKKWAEVLGADVEQLFQEENANGYLLNRWIDEKKLSKMTGFALPTIRGWRSRRQGPSYVKINRAIRYDLNEVLRFMEQHKVIL